MSHEIKVPELGESIVEATVSTWLKKEGDKVNVGETIVELETDKVDIDVSAEKAGVIKSIAKQEGEDVKIGDVLGVIDESALSDDGKGEEEEDSQKEEAKEEKKSGKEPTDEKQAKDDGESDDDDRKEKVKEKQKEKEKEKEKDDRITPVAAKLIEEHELDVKDLKGSGPGGRITKEDVQQFLKKQDGETEEPKKEKEKEEQKEEPKDDRKDKPVEREVSKERTEKRVRMSRRRQTIAKRLVEAQRTAAMLTTFNEVDMSAVMKIRSERKDRFEEKHGVKLGFMSFFVKAVISALKEFPELNAEIQENEIVYKNYYDIGIAVGADEGLVVPVIRDADTLSFATIEKRIREFAQKADEGTLTLEDLKGGTFSITNGGVYGSLLSTPILNPPQVGILGLHKIEERPVIIEKEIVVRPMMYVAVSYDHRIVDGKDSVQFLVNIKELIEDPAAMLLEL